MNYSTQHQGITASRSATAPRWRSRQRAPVLAGVVAALAGMALYVQARTRQVERENPPQGKFIEVDGVRLHYIERGEGAPLVLLHGNGTMAQEFDISGLLDAAAGKYRVIAFDRPGYGYSERPRGTVWDPAAQARLIHHALQQLGVEKPIVAAHSWGTLVAMELALGYPESVASLALLSGYYYPTPRLDVAMFSPPAIPVVGDLMRHTVSPLIGRMMWPVLLRKLFGPAKTPLHFKQNFPVWMTLRPGQLRASAAETALMIPSVFRLRNRYRDLAVPVTILTGANDRHVLARLHSGRLHRELPESDYHAVPGVGHMIQHLAPEQVMGAIDKAASRTGLHPRNVRAASAMAVH